MILKIHSLQQFQAIKNIIDDNKLYHNSVNPLSRFVNLDIVLDLVEILSEKLRICQSYKIDSPIIDFRNSENIYAYQFNSDSNVIYDDIEQKKYELSFLPDNINVDISKKDIESIQKAFLYVSGICSDTTNNYSFNQKDVEEAKRRFPELANAFFMHID